MEEKNDLLWIGEIIKKGVIYNRIPASVAIFQLVYLLGKYHVKLDILSYDSSINRVTFLLEKVYESEKCGLITCNIALSSLKELNDNFPFAVIDCDADPFTPENWKVEEHRKGGFINFDPTKISLYLSKKQEKGYISGYDLRKDLSSESVMNANVLDYLLVHPKLIPEDWKGKYIFFWGTIYIYFGGEFYIGKNRSIDCDFCLEGVLLVRYLGWDGSEWTWCYYRLPYNFSANDQAAITS